MRRHKILETAEYTDLFLFDYKETDSALHKKYTGVGNESILENLKAINDAGKDIILSCPTIPATTTEKNILAASRRLQTALSIFCISSLNRIIR